MPDRMRIPRWIRLSRVARIMPAQHGIGPVDKIAIAFAPRTPSRATTRNI